MNSTSSSDWLAGLLGRLFTIPDVTALHDWSLAFAAEWAARHPAAVAAGCLAACAAAVWFHRRWQSHVAGPARWTLAALRALTLSLLVILLADPVLNLSIESRTRPLLWLLFDASESMAIEDDLSGPERESLAIASGIPAADTASRIEHVAGWVAAPAGNVIGKLAESFRIRGYAFDSAESVRQLEIESAGGPDLERLAGGLSASGQVTAIGGALEDLAVRHAAGNLQGVVLVSDFDQNSGPPALEAARRLGVPIFTVGVGPVASTDLAVDLQAPPVMKRAERASVVATLRQTGLEGGQAEVRLSERPAATAPTAPATVIATRTVTLAGPVMTVDFPLTPELTGRREFAVEVAPLPGEVVDGNNLATREVNVRDDFLRLMYVEYEPTWEWRFIKEVFHRDSLVGMRGFRTYLRSADPRVRTTNELFLTTPAPGRGEFFATDVIFLGDMPASALSNRFCELTREFVERFGGGLVVIAGDRFGPGELAGTPLADMLPVVVEGKQAAVTDKEFRLRLAAGATAADFMRLGGSDEEHAQAWDNLGPLHWYCPVARPHPQATVLAEHPAERCLDGRTPQPLIAIRRFGRGEVVYVGFNETWRLRRKYGERYYRQFWGQMIHRLGLSHALGSQKRFVVRTDAESYRVDDDVVVTVEAYDADFQPLLDKDLPDRRLAARLFTAERGRDGLEPDTVTLAQVRPGTFEGRFRVTAGGEHRIEVADPVTREQADVTFGVTSLSAERRSGLRNGSLQAALAAETGGKAYDLTTAGGLADDVVAKTRPELAVRVVPLGMTWLAFGAFLGLLAIEWLLRKRVNLP